MLSCKQASELLSQAMERDMTLRERFLLRVHLLICDSCKNFSRQIEVMHLACRNYLERKNTRD
ncbi:MAG TPA: zf-HC2 domain-containing protein [Gallionella sp.]|nr:zf-HC2 domain-containing protein [Gallionella sp.]